MSRQGIFNLIDRGQSGTWKSRIYEWYMLVMILASIVPLMFIEFHPVFRTIEIVTVTAFIIDYLIRWSTADYQLKKGYMVSFNFNKKKQVGVREIVLGDKILVEAVV